MRDRLRKLRQLFNHEDRLLILIDADPDSIASALALKRLLWRRLSACTISPIRPITRPQNQTMVKLLEIPLTPFDQIRPVDFQVFGSISVTQGNGESSQMGAHGRVQVLVGPDHMVALLFKHGGQSPHGDAADPHKI